jgi:hypothetical protein
MPMSNPYFLRLFEISKGLPPSREASQSLPSALRHSAGLNTCLQHARGHLQGQMDFTLMASSRGDEGKIRRRHNDA